MAWALVWAGTVSRATRNQTGRVQAGSAPRGPKQSEGRQSRCRFSALPFDFRDALAGKLSTALKVLNGGRQTPAKTVTTSSASDRRRAPSPALPTSSPAMAKAACAFSTGSLRLKDQSIGWLDRYCLRRYPDLTPQGYRTLDDLRPVAPNPMSLASFERAAL